MKPTLQFLRTTLAGGVLFLVPIIVLIVILGKAAAIAYKLVDPLAARLPFESLIGLRTPVALVIGLIVLFGFLVERLENGSVAVFIPGAPNPYSGAVYFMTADRVRPAAVPPAAAMKCLKRLGAGSNALLRCLAHEAPTAK
jgi:uncharacterized membrane protein